jgi:lipoyl(octanoyl) transferase
MATATRASIRVASLGLMDYREALALQREIHRKVVGGESESTLLFLEHPPIFTAGKRTSIEERPTSQLEVIDVDRGGKITFHGPGQLIGYPIVRLQNPLDVLSFVRELESAILRICSDFSITALRVPGRSGVWVKDDLGERKIAAIGIRVARGVTMHGFAINVDPDLSYFDQIIPCGISDASVTSFAQELGAKMGIEAVLESATYHLLETLQKVAR